jgi:hypothetical protein
MAKHPLPPGPWIRFVLYFNAVDTGFQNEIWYQVTAPGSTTDLPAVLYEFTTLIAANLMPNVASTITLYAIKLYANNGTFTVSYVNYPDLAGGSTSTPIPTEVTLIGALKADIATRKAQGRIFISGLTVDDVDGDYPSTAAHTWVNAFLDALGGFVEASAWEFALAVWERVNATLHDVLVSGLSGVIGSLRTRRPRI